MASCNENVASSLALLDPDTDYDNLYGDNNEDNNENNDPTKFVKPSRSETDEPDNPECDIKDQIYLLGTLIIRVVAARDLEPVYKGSDVGRGLGMLLGGGGGRDRKAGSANPYASVKFGDTTQRTCEVFDTLDPIWPRQETLFMDVALPVAKLTHPNSRGSENSSCTGVAFPAPTKEKPYEKPNTILTLALFHNPGLGKSMYKSDSDSKYPQKGGKGASCGDSNDVFMGMTSVDMTRLLTGTESTFDQWLTLGGTETSRGSVRIVCEYESADPPPRPRDYCRFTTFCHPRQLYPLIPGEQYQVEEVNGDFILVSYKSQEGWLCTFETHRFMLICQENPSPVETAQDELVVIAERLSRSPLVHRVTETMEQVAVDGLLLVGKEIVRGGFGLFKRWKEGGVDTVIGDVVDATNWDGRHDPDHADSLDLPETNPSISQDEQDRQESNLKSAPADIFDSEYGDAVDPTAQALEGMPSCPITGEPMLDPVVAADGKRQFVQL